jgi:toxin FitB
VYVLDSDVLTIISGSRRFQNVQRWYDKLNETDIFLSVFAIKEKSKGAVMAAKRGDAATAAKVEASLSKLKAIFAGRILSLDAVAAEDWGRMIGAKNSHVDDKGLAAIAKGRNFVVATRNVPDFVGRGAKVVNPYEADPKIINP